MSDDRDKRRDRAWRLLNDVFVVATGQGHDTAEKHLRMHPKTWLSIKLAEAELGPTLTPVNPTKPGRQTLCGVSVIVDEGEAPGEVTLRIEHTITIDMGHET